MISETEIMDQWTIISDCITKPDESPQAIAILTPDMFTEPGCRDVFSVFVTLQKEGLPTDINHTLERLENSGKLSQALGVRLHQAACDARATQPVTYYAERVREHHRKRVARDILLQHHQDLLNSHGLPETLTALQTAMDGLQVNKAVSLAHRRQSYDSGFSPFPVHALPNAVRGFIRSASSAIGCDDSFVALPMLSAAASVIGTTRKLMVKRGWFVPSILWTVVIGESGTQKSPPMRTVMKPLQVRQNERLSKFAAELAEYKRELQTYRKLIRKSVTFVGNPPTEPQVPICERCIVSDTTMEGLVPILQQNPRGVLLSRDELVGWVGSFDKYSSKGNASADVAHWLSIFNAESVIVDRKTGDKTTLFVPDASVSV